MNDDRNVAILSLPVPEHTKIRDGDLRRARGIVLCALALAAGGLAVPERPSGLLPFVVHPVLVAFAPRDLIRTSVLSWRRLVHARGVDGDAGGVLRHQDDVAAGRVRHVAERLEGVGGFGGGRDGILCRSGCAPKHVVGRYRSPRHDRVPNHVLEAGGEGRILPHVLERELGGG